MFASLFGSRALRQVEPVRFCRPELEALEDRLPPSSMQGGDPPGHNMVNIHNNIHITDSFNGSFNGASFGFALAGALSNPQLGSLINDEIALAVDTYLASFPAIASAIPSLGTDITKLQDAINANPLESTMVGQVLGMLAYDLTTNALTSAQPTI